MNQRIYTLLEILKSEPDDAFTLYALGLEYSQTDTETALHYFHLVVNTHPDYVPVYYQLGKIYTKNGQTEQAEYFYRIGIEKALMQGDSHAQSELRNALQNLLLGLEED